VAELTTSQGTGLIHTVFLVPSPEGGSMSAEISMPTLAFHVTLSIADMDQDTDNLRCSDAPHLPARDGPRIRADTFTKNHNGDQIEFTSKKPLGALQWLPRIWRLFERSFLVFWIVCDEQFIG
jgi:hypothetical protein